MEFKQIIPTEWNSGAYNICCSDYDCYYIGQISQGTALKTFALQDFKKIPNGNWVLIKYAAVTVTVMT